MSKPVITDSVSEIVAKFKVGVVANNAKLQADLNSTLNRKAPATSQPSAGKIGAWTPLPKHSRDEGDFHERLSTSLHTTAW